METNLLTPLLSWVGFWHDCQSPHPPPFMGRFLKFDPSPHHPPFMGRFLKFDPSPHPPTPSPQSLIFISIILNNLSLDKGGGNLRR